MILATDLDGTFLGGSEFHKRILYSLLGQRKDILLIFVTGRGLDSVSSVLEDSQIPRPDYIIADVGATIVDGSSLRAIETLQNDIDAKWPGKLKIAKMLGQVNGLVLQNVPQHRRCSFFADNENVYHQVKARLSALPCEIIYSADKYLDILPQGVNKGRSLAALINHLREDELRVIVAGDTLNDLSMFQCNFKGVMVGNSEPKLQKAVEGIDGIFAAKRDGAGGILEALLHFAVLPGSMVPEINEYMQKD